jgi:hypothetical protein
MNAKLRNRLSLFIDSQRGVRDDDPSELALWVGMCLMLGVALALVGISLGVVPL